VKATSNPFPAQLRAQASDEATAAAVEAALQSPGALLADATFSAEAGHSEATELALALTAALRWLQAAEPLANPYYGAEMLRCGVFEKL
jgi:hypothetical protein